MAELSLLVQARRQTRTDAAEPIWEIDLVPDGDASAFVTTSVPASELDRWPIGGRVVFTAAGVSSIADGG